MFEEIDEKEAMELLKKEATELGIVFSPNIGFETLTSRIDTKRQEILAAEKATEEGKLADKEFIRKARLAAEKIHYTNPMAKVLAKMKPQQRKIELMKQASKLVRCSVTCLDPSKKDVPGAILGVRNSMVPLGKRFVPYDGRTTHLPQILVNHLKEKEFQSFKIEVNSRTGENERKPFINKMYSVVILADLTKKELDELAEAQRAAGTID